MTKCTFHKFGTSGEIEKHDAMCILPLNIGNHEMLPACLWQSAISVNEKIYIFIWFWFLLLGFLTFLVLLYRILIVFSPRIRVSYFLVPVLCTGVDIEYFCNSFWSVKTVLFYCLLVLVVHEFDHSVRLWGGLGWYDKQWSNSPALHSFTASLPSDINETVFTSHPHSYLRRCSRALGRMRLFITDPSRGVYPPLTAGLQSHWSAGHIVYSNAW